MRRVLNIFFIALCTFFCVTNVFAECTDEEYKELKQLSKKIEVGYKYNDDSGYFSLEIYNLTNKFDVYLSNNAYIMGFGNTPFSLGMYLPGSKEKVYVSASSNTKCYGLDFKTITVKLPNYNKYYSRKECVGNETLNICKKWYDTENLSEEKFLEIINGNKENDIKLYKKILLFIISNWIYFALGFVFIILIVVALIIKHKKSKRSSLDI